MPAINTGGFNVSVMPGINRLNPQLFAPAYGDIVPAAIGTYAQLADIRRRGEDAVLDKQLKLAQLDRAQRDMGPEIIEEVTPLDETKEGTVYDTPAVEEGQPALPPEKQWGNLYKIERGYRIGPGGVKIPFVRKVLVKDAESRRREAALDASQIDYRAVTAEAAQARADNAKLAAELKASKDNPYQLLGRGQDENGRLVAILLDKRTDDIVQKTTSVSPINTGFSAILERMLGGGSADPGRSPTELPSIAVPGADLTPGAKVTMQLIDGIPAPRNQAEYISLPPGTVYIGPDGRKRTKK